MGVVDKKVAPFSYPGGFSSQKLGGEWVAFATAVGPEGEARFACTLPGEPDANDVHKLKKEVSSLYRIRFGAWAESLTVTSRDEETLPRKTFNRRR